MWKKLKRRQRSKTKMKEVKAKSEGCKVKGEA